MEKGEVPYSTPLSEYDEWQDSDIITFPAAIDLHVHAREPSLVNTSETIASTTEAAAAGGVQAIADMPNTPKLETWTYDRLMQKHEIALERALVHCAFWAGFDGDSPDKDELTRMFLEAVGLKAYAGETTGNAKVRTIAELRDPFDHRIGLARRLGTRSPIVFHAEGEVGRDIGEYIAQQDHPAHWAHLASEEEVEHVQNLKEKYGSELISSEVTPHHLMMTEDDEEKYGPLAVCKPSIQTSGDRRALFAALAEGVIDAVATDYAPHPIDKKVEALPDMHGHKGEPCYGISGGLDFMVPMLLAKVLTGKLSKERFIDATYTQPKRILGLPEDSMKTEVEFMVGPHWIDPIEHTSMSRNTPFINWLSGGHVVGFVEPIGNIEVIKAQPREAV